MKVPKPSGKVLFKETQQFRQGWLWAMVISSSVMPLLLVSVLLSQDKKVSAAEMFGILAFVGGLSLINIVLLIVVKFDTMVTDDAVYYRWRPFNKLYRQVPWASVEQVIIKKFSDFKIGYFKHKTLGRAHIVDGNRGVQIIVTNGKPLYLGTQKLSALQHSLEQMKPVTTETREIKDRYKI